MRKAIVEVEITGLSKKMFERTYEHVERMELIEMLQMDFQKFLKIALVKLTMKDGKTPEDMKLPKGSRIIEVIPYRDNEFVCVVRADIPKTMQPMMKLMDLGLIFTTPCHLKGGKFVLSIIGDNESIQKFLKYYKMIGDIKSVAYQKASFDDSTLVSSLTDKQREVMTAAKHMGYYDYPRKVKAEEVAEQVGISKATAVEHLRKGEIRLISSVLAGY